MVENGVREHLSQLKHCEAKKNTMIDGDLIKFMECQTQKKGPGIYCKKEANANWDNSE